MSWRRLVATYTWLIVFFGLSVLVLLYVRYHRFSPERWREACAGRSRPINVTGTVWSTT